MAILNHWIIPFVQGQGGFLPPGCPGPYRVALGFYGKIKTTQGILRGKIIHK